MGGMELLATSTKHAAAPIGEWGRQRFGGADIPAEQRLADLENTLALVKLDPAENAPLLAPLLDIPLPQDRAATSEPEVLRAPAADSPHQLGNGQRANSAAGAGIRRRALGRSDDGRLVAGHCRARCAGALVRSYQRPARVPASLGHAFASQHDLPGTA